ncbi:unnamed protein product [Fraxinus pennsylvanica]|uniref:DNA2/NAM7 helicase-like C-terminal domain-containing protein n=1 Tax=Fraxinus pennsylvanica TaxID=56036 RepID=A0AAD2DPP5_9LAMI|nr:unnamed protein product [Fraxinus pennsylvanica]
MPAMVIRQSIHRYGDDASDGGQAISRHATSIHGNGDSDGDVDDATKLVVVDGFQGQKVDILPLSTVRAAGSKAPRINSGNLGFVTDVRRMNVSGQTFFMDFG